MEPICDKLRLAGCYIKYTKEGLILKAPEKIKAIDLVKTHPHPGFPTDMQAQLMTLMTLSDSVSVFYETIFENRFMHVMELRRMGANISIYDRVAVIDGVKSFVPSRVKATDLRAGAALILAALSCKGESEITDIYHIDRGYAQIENKLKNLNAKIVRIDE